MTDQAHRFRVGQIVDLVPATFRPAASGHYEIVALRPTDGENPQYRVKSKDEAHERVVSESELVLVES